MKPIDFPASDNVHGAGQPQYLPLPTHTFDGGDGHIIVTSCWQLSRWERVQILFTGKIWWTQMTFGEALQPQLPYIKKPTFVQ